MVLLWRILIILVCRIEIRKNILSHQVYEKKVVEMPQKRVFNYFRKFIADSMFEGFQKDSN